MNAVGDPAHDPSRWICKVGANVSVREEGDRFLMVNLVTQGLHLVSPTSYRLIQALDGEITLAAAIDGLWPDCTDAEREKMHGFITKLIDRKILEVAG